jgi:hypothetical protein
VDIPDKVLEKRIHLAEVRAKRARHFCCGAFWASAEQQEQRDEVGEGVPPVLGLLLVLAIE